MLALDLAVSEGDEVVQVFISRISPTKSTGMIQTYNLTKPGEYGKMVLAFEVYLDTPPISLISYLRKLSRAK